MCCAGDGRRDHPTRFDENDDGSIYADIVQNGGIPLNIIKSIWFN